MSEQKKGKLKKIIQLAAIFVSFISCAITVRILDTRRKNHGKLSEKDEH